jgi:hypothetical protein
MVYNKDLRQLSERTESNSGVPNEQLVSRNERFSGVGSWQSNREEMARKELVCAKKTS